MSLQYRCDEEDILLVITPHRYAVLSSTSHYPGNELVGLLLSGFRAALITLSDMAPTTQHPDGWLVILPGYNRNPCKPWHLSFTLTLRVGGNCQDDSVDANSSILYHWTGTLIRHICLAQKRHYLLLQSALYSKLAYKSMNERQIVLFLKQFIYLLYLRCITIITRSVLQRQDVSIRYIERKKLLLRI